MDWTRDRDDAEREDRFLPLDALVRVGVGARTEVQFAWSPLGHVRTRDGGGLSDRRTRVGDVELAVRRSLRNPDGSGLSYGLQPFVVLPVGRRPAGDGTWSTGIVLPLTYDVTDVVNVGVTGDLRAQANESGRGRHFQATAIAAASLALTRKLTVTIEGELIHDDDPAGRELHESAALGLQWSFRRTRALYAEIIHGLNADAPDLQLMVGASALF